MPFYQSRLAEAKNELIMVDSINNDAQAIGLDPQFSIVDVHITGQKFVPLRNVRRHEGELLIPVYDGDRSNEVLGIVLIVTTERLGIGGERYLRPLLLAGKNAQCRRAAQHHHRGANRTTIPIRVAIEGVEDE